MKIKPAKISPIEFYLANIGTGIEDSAAKKLAREPENKPEPALVTLPFVKAPSVEEKS